MKKLDKNKLILPTAIVLGCLVLGGAFYEIQANKQKSIEKQTQINNQIKCQNEGNKLYSSIVKEDSLSHYFTPEFKFNNELNTCFMQLTRDNFNSTYEVSDIINVYENKVVIRYSQRFWNDKWEDHIGTKEQWDTMVKELFN